MLLTNLVGKIYKVCFEIGLWLTIIIFPIAGGIGGKALSSWGSDYTGLGVLGGFIIGCCLCICSGFIVKLLKLDE